MASSCTSATQVSQTPVTIITGFLGAGKTTLLNHILKEKGDRSIAVIENEFGEVNIDRALVADNLIEQEDLVSLENGCVCCSLRKDVVKALAEIERRSRTKGKRVDTVILETTGLADPAPVAFTFFANPWVASRFKLDSIVCVVDARYLLQHLEDAEREEGSVNEAVNQLAFADLILLNKVDLVSPAELQPVRAAIQKINNSAKIVECQLTSQHKPPLDALLNTNLFSVSRALEIDPAFLDSDSEDSDFEDEEEQCDNEVEHAHPPACTLHPPPQRQPHAQSKASPSQPAIPSAPQPSQPVLGSSVSEGSAQPSTQHDATHHRLEPSASGPSATQSFKGRLAGAKHGRDDDCADMCEECPIAKGESVKGERQPKRRRKKLHDLSNIVSVAITARGPLDEYRFNMYMRDLLAEKAKDLFRCKGVLCVHGYGSQKFVFQGVHETIVYGPAEAPWGENEPRVNQVVFIGRGLDRKSLIDGFRTCVWVPLPEGWVEYKDKVSNQPWYLNQRTGEKSWVRPIYASAHVVASSMIAEQPATLQPRKGPSRNPSVISPTAVAQACANIEKQIAQAERQLTQLAEKQKAQAEKESAQS